MTTKNRFWEIFPQQSITNKEDYRFSSLNRINEVSEWSSSDSNSVRVQMPIKKDYMKKHRRFITEHLEPILSDNLDVAFFQKFLMNLHKHSNVYESFLNSSFLLKVLSHSTCSSSLYYYKHIHYSNHDKFHKSLNRTNETSDDYGLTPIENLNTYDDSFAYNSNTKSKMLDVLKHNRSHSETVELSDNSKVKRIKKKKMRRPSLFNKPSNKVIKIFQDMCGSQQISLKALRLTNYLFKQYLSKIFRPEMADTISKYFDFKSSNLEDFITEIDRILSSKEENQLKLCFDAFDINKDKYICYQDTYSLIESRKGDVFDSDLIKISSMFEMKKNGHLPVLKHNSHKGRRQSVMSIASDTNQFEEANRKNEVPPIHPTKPEALTFEDFVHIDFKGKPQLLVSLFKYICNVDITTGQEILTPLPQSRRNSEDLVFDSNHIKLADKEELRYLEDLGEKMRYFKYDKLKDLLQKFEILRDKTNLNGKIITRASMVENWEKVFGECSSLVCERFYYFFSRQMYREVNKSMFLERIHEFLNDENTNSRFAFEFFDYRNDERITSDEVYKIEQCLPKGSAIHRECVLLIEELAAGIFERKRVSLKEIDFKLFLDILPRSVLCQEFLSFIEIPVDKLNGSQNISWKINI